MCASSAITANLSAEKRLNIYRSASRTLALALPRTYEGDHAPADRQMVEFKPFHYGRMRPIVASLVLLDGTNFAIAGLLAIGLAAEGIQVEMKMIAVGCVGFRAQYRFEFLAGPLVKAIQKLRGNSLLHCPDALWHTNASC